MLYPNLQKNLLLLLEDEKLVLSAIGELLEYFSQKDSFSIETCSPDFFYGKMGVCLPFDEMVDEDVEKCISIIKDQFVNLEQLDEKTIEYHGDWVTIYLEKLLISYNCGHQAHWEFLVILDEEKYEEDFYYGAWH